MYDQNNSATKVIDDDQKQNPGDVYSYVSLFKRYIFEENLSLQNVTVHAEVTSRVTSYVFCQSIEVKSMGSWL